MKMRVASLIVVAALGVTGCGDDEPDVVSAPDTIERTSAFDTLDSNGDSYLDADEIAETRDGDVWFDSWDADADSELDPDEIAGNAFELWDADGNGTVSETEWQDATELWYPEDATVTVFSDWDGDGDSELDTDEFTERFDASLLGESWSTGTIDESTFENAYFELYDADDDGKVSDVEWRTGSAIWGTPEE